MNSTNLLVTIFDVNVNDNDNDDNDDSNNKITKYVVILYD